MQAELLSLQVHKSGSDHPSNEVHQLRRDLQAREEEIDRAHAELNELRWPDTSSLGTLTPSPRLARTRTPELDSYVVISVISVLITSDGLPSFFFAVPLQPVFRKSENCSEQPAPRMAPLFLYLANTPLPHRVRPTIMEILGFPRPRT